MHTMHPTLLIGPADWDAARLPREEFQSRIDALWETWPTAQGALVFGSPISHAELAYLTNFTPKLDSALALIPRAGAPRLLVGGGVRMVPAAKPLTWIEALGSFQNAGKTVAEWTATLPAGGIVPIGCDGMRPALRREIFAGLDPDSAQCDGAGALTQQMRIKSAHERAAITEACTMLDAALAAIQQAKASGASTTDAVLAGEQAVHRLGAQDVRTLFSRDGGRTLQPFEMTLPELTDPLQISVAVRHAGYWAEGFSLLADKAPAPLDHARAALHTALAHAKPGTRRSEIAEYVMTAAWPYAPHPAAMPVVQSIGLSLEESAGADDALSTGEIVSLRVGVTDAQEGAAIVSAIVAIMDGGHDLLWIAPGAER